MQEKRAQQTATSAEFQGLSFDWAQPCSPQCIETFKVCNSKMLVRTDSVNLFGIPNRTAQPSRGRNVRRAWQSMCNPGATVAEGAGHHFARNDRLPAGDDQEGRNLSKRIAQRAAFFPLKQGRFAATAIRFTPLLCYAPASSRALDRI